MTRSADIARARECFEGRAWEAARTHFSETDSEGDLDPEDLRRWAVAAYLVGKDTESEEVWTRAHHDLLERGDAVGAVRCALRLAFQLLNRGESARAGGWNARAERLLDGVEEDCAERGYLILPAALRLIFGGNDEASYEAFGRAAEIGERFDDPDLTALARNGRGRALIRMGRVEQGLSLLDETMVAVEAEEVSPIVAGDIYCSVIEACHEVFDVGRAQEWTSALSRWCESQPDLVAFRGQCLVRRAEILQLRGAWAEAMDEAVQAWEHLTREAGEPAAGEALYRRAELHRLRGEFEEAERTYREASKWGRKPQPGLALLRLAQGRVETARVAVSRVLEEAKNLRTRSRVLPACAEIMLECGDVEAARAAADELSQIAADLDVPFLNAEAAGARGSVLLAEGQADSALHELREAWSIWGRLEVPYRAARVRVLIARACREVGDDDTAEVELAAAHWALERLGAEPDRIRVESLARGVPSGPSHGLTPRQLQVLRLVATGETNRAIAERLFISEKTVARHISDILTRLGLSNRTAAAAYAYEHDLA